jgi:hypothetical protein
MALDNSERKRVEELFTLYRNNYKKFEIVGEPGTFDFAIHTCGEKTFPNYLEPSTYYKNHWTFETDLSSEQSQLIDSTYKLILFNFKLFSEAVKQAKGLWREYILESMQRSNKFIPNITGQIGDILGVIAPNYLEVLDSVASNIIMKKINGYGPNERKGIISDKYFELFVEKNYVCSHFEEVECNICSRKFLPQSQNEWVGLVPPVYCGFCLEMGFSASTEFFREIGFSKEQQKSNYIEGVRIYTDYFGFIPNVKNKKRTVLTQFFLSGIDADELSFAVKVSSLLPWHETAKKLFGSWAHLLEGADLLSNRQRGRGGHQSISTDGHLCLSLGERAICEYLTKNGCAHEKEPMYPFHEVLNPNNLLRGDFLVNGVIIEFAGMMSNPNYASRMKTKQTLAKTMKLKWLKLEASSLNDLNLMLEEIKSEA